MMFLLSATAVAGAGPGPSGAEIMAEAARRHEHYPHVYEEQSLILIDAAGNRVTYQLRRFTRIDEDGGLRLLLVFDNPPEVRGVALRALHPAGGERHTGVYLPAFGPVIKEGAGAGRASRFLGTDFSVGDLLPEDPQRFDYRRLEDQSIGELAHYVVEALPRAADPPFARRRHFVRQDNLFIVRTDYFDHQGRLAKTRTRFDLKRVDGDMWRADMLLMADHRLEHRSLVKVLRRVFSRDYVPPRVFDSEWLTANRHMEETSEMLRRSLAPAAGGEEDE